MPPRTPRRKWKWPRRRRGITKEGEDDPSSSSFFVERHDSGSDSDDDASSGPDSDPDLAPQTPPPATSTSSPTTTVQERPRPPTSDSDDSEDDEVTWGRSLQPSAPSPLFSGWTPRSFDTSLRRRLDRVSVDDPTPPAPTASPRPLIKSIFMIFLLVAAIKACIWLVREGEVGYAVLAPGSSMGLEADDIVELGGSDVVVLVEADDLGVEVVAEGEDIENESLVDFIDPELSRRLDEYESSLSSSPVAVLKVAVEEFEELEKELKAKKGTTAYHRGVEEVEVKRGVVGGLIGVVEEVVVDVAERIKEEEKTVGMTVEDLMSMVQEELKGESDHGEEGVKEDLAGAVGRMWNEYDGGEVGRLTEIDIDVGGEEVIPAPQSDEGEMGTEEARSRVERAVASWEREEAEMLTKEEEEEEEEEEKEGDSISTFIPMDHVSETDSDSESNSSGSDDSEGEETSLPVASLVPTRGPDLASVRQNSRPYNLDPPPTLTHKLFAVALSYLRGPASSIAFSNNSARYCGGVGVTLSRPVEVRGTVLVDPASDLTQVYAVVEGGGREQLAGEGEGRWIITGRADGVEVEVGGGECVTRVSVYEE